MGTIIRCALVAFTLALGNVLCAYPQLLPQVTPPPTKPLASKPAQIVIQTAPNAQVYLDDVYKGQASPQGRLVIANAKPGDHALRVSLAGKRNREQKVTVIAGQVARITAVLADLAGTVVVQTSPGAAVFLDDSSRGTTDAGGQLSVPDVAAGSHQLRITAAGKKEYRQNITVSAGQEARAEARLATLAGTIVVQTSPGAEVLLDSASRGTADASGQMAIPEVAAGSHELRVTASGKTEYRQNITVPAGQEARIEAPLADLAGSVLVQTSPGAAVYLDDSSRGTTDASGQLSIPDAAAGSHELRITASGKTEYRQDITVAAGQEARVEAALTSPPPPPPPRSPPVEVPDPTLKAAQEHLERGEAVLLRGGSNRKKNAESAIPELKEATRLNPHDSRAHAALGVAYFRVNAKDAAINEYREAIRLDPAYAGAHGFLGEALAAERSYDEAIAQLREAIRLSPAEASPHDWLAGVLREKRDWDGAIAEEREAVRLEPQDGWKHFRLGSLLEKKGDLQSALTEYQEACRITSNMFGGCDDYKRLRKKLRNP